MAPLGRSALLMLLLGCGAQAPSEFTLVDHSGWRVAELLEDPFLDRPAALYCQSSGTQVEGDGETGVFEVDTRVCGYVTAIHPTLQAIEAGDSLSLTIWHLALRADAPAEAHIAVRLGDHTLADQRVPIPSEATVYQHSWTAKAALPAGAPLYFHVHNHGYNNYRLAPVRVIHLGD